jgi:hypothetical protein
MVRMRGAVGNIILQNFILVLSLGLALLNASPGLAEENVPCDRYAHELSKECIAELGLQEKVAFFESKIAEAQRRYGASYKIRLQVIGEAIREGHDANTAPVFLDFDEQVRTTFKVFVTSRFLAKAPEIMFEHSALHEVAHIINDDLPGYHRYRADCEVAEERVVLNLVGEERYKEYLQAYAKYKDWPPSKYEEFLQKVKALKLLPAPGEIDEADRAAAIAFRRIVDGKEHLLVYNGEIHDISIHSTGSTVGHDLEKLAEVIKAGKPMIFFHNHPCTDSAAMFPSSKDFGVAALFEYLVRRENPDLNLEYRLVVADDKESTFISYGFQKPLVEEVKKLAASYREVRTPDERERIDLQIKILTHQVAQESFDTYLQHACPVELTCKDAEVCNTNPRFFIWPSEKYFLTYRGVVDYSVDEPE